MCAENAACLNVSDKETLAQPPRPPTHVQVVIFKVPVCCWGAGVQDVQSDWSIWG